MRFRYSLASLVLAVAGLAHAQTTPTAFPVPFSTALAGLGAASTSSCSANILATDGTNYGDGCVGTQARLSSPQGAAVDKYGNVYVADYSDRLVRVIYNGGPYLAAAITAANSGYAVSATRNAPATAPSKGKIYTLVGSGETLLTFTAMATDGNYACANYAGAGQPEASDYIGDGCPGGAAMTGPRAVNVDNDGNVIITDYSYNRIRIFCVNCSSKALATSLIELENPGVVPANGKVYTVAGYSSASTTTAGTGTAGYRDVVPGYGNASTTPVTPVPTTPMTSALFRSPTTSAVSPSDDIFVADNLNNAVRVLYNGGTAAYNILHAQGFTPKVGYVYTVAGLGCDSADSSHTGATTSANSCKTTTGSDTPQLASVPGTPNNATTTGVGISVAWAVYLDANGNVYYPDSGNKRIKVIYAGIAAPLTIAATSSQVGYTFSFAGQGTQTATGVAPSAEQLNSPQGVGGDASGDIFFIDYGTGLFYETYASNGLTAIIGGNGGSGSSTAGAYCNGGSTGPITTDTRYDGCPTTQVGFSSPRGPLVADAAGNLYFGDSVGYYLREFSYNTTFPSTPAGTASAAQPIAFTSAATVGAVALREGAVSGPDFGDAGNDTCPATAANTTCVVNIFFKPTTAGVHSGAAVPMTSSAAQGYSLLSGMGTGAALNVDPGTSTVTGSAAQPNAVAVDGSGNVYVADLSSKSVLRYTGGTATTIASGFNAPSGVAVDGAGDVFVADSAANTITEISALAPATPFALIKGLNAPHGLATDTSGNLYISDTGDNRVLMAPAGTSAFSVAAFTGLTAPKDVALDANGNVYAIDGAHILKVDSTGAQTTVAATGGTAVAVDTAGNVLAASGTSLTEYPANTPSTPVTLSSGFTTPQGVALDASGDAFVADNAIKGFTEIQRTAGYYKFTSNPATTTLTLTSAGTANVASTAFTASETTDYTITAASTNGCSGSLATGSTCALTAKFAGTSPCVTPDSIVFTSPVTNGAPGFTLTSTSVEPCLSVIALPSTVVYGASVTLTGTVSGTTSTAGNVVFSSGTALLSTQATNTSGVATYSYIPAVNTYSVTASFTPTGSTSATLTSQAATFTVTKATPTIGVQASPTTGYTSTAFTLTATLGATYGTPTGSVTFYSGTTSVGQAPIIGSTAVLNNVSLPSGTDCITATYGSDANFTTVTSTGCTTVNVAPGFAVTATSTSLSFPSASYQEAQTYLSIVPGGRTDTLTFACSGLPAKLSCAFSPSSLNLTGLSAAQTVQMLVSNSSAHAALHITQSMTLASLPFAGLAILLIRRRRRVASLLFALIVTGVVLLQTTGCGNSPVARQQSGGTYPFTVTVSSGSTVLQTLNFTLNVPSN